eukprot:1407197-Alexandrium_andersonii.AAC.1
MAAVASCRPGRPPSMNLTMCQSCGAISIAVGVCLPPGIGQVAPSGPAKKANRHVHVMQATLSHVRHYRA